MKKTISSFLLFCFAALVFPYNHLFAQEDIVAPSTELSSYIQVLNYPSLEKVLRYEKLELGVQLEADVAEKVDNFVTKANVPSTKKLNPYLDWELRVYAKFKKKNSADSAIVVDGFYTKEFTSWSAERLPMPADKDKYSTQEYKNIGGWKEEESAFPFHIRFAPPEIGDWTVTVYVLEKRFLVYQSEEISFRVVASDNPGNVGVSANKRFLAINNETFFPIGCNHPWPETDSLSDPELFNYMAYRDHDLRYFRSNEGYRENYAAPRVYEKYKQTISALADNGVNYIRTIMYPSATDIEWEEVGNYTNRLAMAQEMDHILELAEARDVYIHFNMQIHYSFQFSERAYYRGWSWDAKIEGVPFGYRALMKTDNPIDFLKNEEAKKYYKQRLRYILARWGYSTNIAAWELFSEITNVGSPLADNNDFYMEGENWKMYRDWQVEMAAYLKSHYHGRNHLVTASFGGPKKPEDNTFADPNFDIMTSNIYDFEAPDFAGFWTSTVQKHYLNDEISTRNYAASYTVSESEVNGKQAEQAIIKPMIYSETDPIGADCDPTKIELRRSMHQSLFAGLAGSLSWYARLHPAVYPVFNEMRQFIEQVDLAGEGWHPGGMKQDENGFWTYQASFAEEMDGNVKVRGQKGLKNRTTDLIYLRSGDRNFAIGVITNKTYNIKTQSTCFPEEEWPKNYSTLNEAQTIDLSKNDLVLRGVSSSRYIIDYYLPSDLSKPFYTSDDRGEKVKMNVVIPATDKEFVVYFMARRKNYDWKLKRKLSREELKTK